MILMLYAVVFHPAYGLGAAAVGLAAGVVAAATRWRVPLAAAAGIAASLAPLQAVDATGGTPESSYLIGAHHLGTSTGLLVAAALAVIGLGVAASLRGRHRAAPAATGETGPVSKGS